MKYMNKAVLIDTVLPHSVVKIGKKVFDFLTN